MQHKSSHPGSRPASGNKGLPLLRNPLLELRELTIQFSGKSVLRHINLSIERGETLAIVGESGSGKSLTALSLLHLLPAHADVSGRILLKDIGTGAEGFNGSDSPEPYTDITFLDDRSMQQIRGAQIGMIFQEPMTSLNPVKTCGDQLTEAILTHLDTKGGVSKKQAKERARSKVLQLFADVRLPEPRLVFD